MIFESAQKSGLKDLNLQRLNSVMAVSKRARLERLPKSAAPVSVASAEAGLAKARLHWQLGEWQSLLAVCEATWALDEKNGELALFAAVACGQLGLLNQARVWVDSAVQAGVEKDQAALALLSGAFNTLAKAHLLRSPEQSEQARALSLFAQSAQLGLGVQAVPGVIKARAQNEVEALESKLFPHNVLSSNLTAALLNVSALTSLSFEASLPDVSLHYKYSTELGVWLREGDADFGYSDGDAVEERILNAVRSSRDVSLFSTELLAHQQDWASLYHLSADRVNVLRPFAAKLAQSSVLELGCGCGAITRYLGELGAQVMAVEGSVRRSTIAASRCRDLENVTVVCDRLQDIPFEGAFDVVTLIGVLEYSRVYVEAVDPIASVLERARRYLKPSGVLIVAIENQLGLKYFAGAPEDHGVGIMAGINDLYRADSAVTFGHKELCTQFEQAGFDKVDTFLPFPDYKFPMLMVHSAAQALAPDDWNLATLLRNSVYFERQKIENPLFALERAWPLVARNGLLKDLANSHVFVACRSLESTVADGAVLASYYSPKRAAQYSQQIEFCVDQQANVLVRRMSLADTSLTANSAAAHTEVYQSGSLHGDALHDVVHDVGWSVDAVVSWAQIWVEALREHLIEPDAQAKTLGWGSYDEWLPGGFLDAIPRNLIISSNDEKVFIDLEWHEAHALPLLLVVYRGLLVTFATLTSVAEPEDKRWLDSEYLIAEVLKSFNWQMTDLDYANFMPVIDQLSRRAHGLELAENPPTKAYTSKVLETRSNVKNKKHSKTVLTLYWQTPELGYSEDRTVKRVWSMSGEVVSFALNLPQDLAVCRSLRLDIAGCTGCFFLHELSIENASGDIIWQWDFDLTLFARVADLQMFNVAGYDQACLISTGADPQFELNLSEAVLQQLASGKVNIQLTGMVYAPG